jgi:hypothetical protein
MYPSISIGGNEKMGVWVGYNDRMIWSPSLKTGHLFAAEIKALEQTVGQRSGISTTMSDTLEIDPPAFAAFIQAVLGLLEETNSGPLLAMTAGCLEVAIALNVKITGHWPEVSESLQPLVRRARTVMAARATQSVAVPA